MSSQSMTTHKLIAMGFKIKNDDEVELPVWRCDLSTNPPMYVDATDTSGQFITSEEQDEIVVSLHVGNDEAHGLIVFENGSTDEFYEIWSANPSWLSLRNGTTM